MSVSQFPNVTEAKVDTILDLLEQLIGPAMTEPIVENEITIILGASMCAATETILASQTIQQYQPYDPAIVKQIQDTLNSCR